MYENRPRIKNEFGRLDYLLERASLLALVVLIGYPAYVFPELPESIPRHFNYLGQADAYEAKWILFIPAAVGSGAQRWT